MWFSFLRWYITGQLGPLLSIFGPLLGLSGPSSAPFGPSLGISGPLLGISGPLLGPFGPLLGPFGPSLGPWGPSLGCFGPSQVDSWSSVPQLYLVLHKLTVGPSSGCIWSYIRWQLVLRRVLFGPSLGLEVPPAHAPHIVGIRWTSAASLRTPAEFAAFLKSQKVWLAVNLYYLVLLLFEIGKRLCSSVRLYVYVLQHTSIDVYRRR